MTTMHTLHDTLHAPCTFRVSGTVTTTLHRPPCMRPGLLTTGSRRCTVQGVRRARGCKVHGGHRLTRAVRGCHDSTRRYSKRGLLPGTNTCSITPMRTRYRRRCRSSTVSCLASVVASISSRVSITFPVLLTAWTRDRAGRHPERVNGGRSRRCARQCGIAMQRGTAPTQRRITRAARPCAGGSDRSWRRAIRRSRRVHTHRL
jgi:hypothetical protein